MALDQVRLGTPPTGQDGDDPRTAFTRINNNFKQLDETGITGPVVQTREVSNYNDANQPGDFIATASASNRPYGFGRATVRVSVAFDDAVTQHAVDHTTGSAATRSFNPANDSWSGWNNGGGSVGVIQIEQGGTGAETAEGARLALGLKALATEDVAPVSKGGTGSQSAAGARQNLGLGAAAVEDIVPVSKGGTGTAQGKFTGATSSTPGSMGLVPAPAVGETGKVLHSDGTWRDPAAGGSGRFFGELVMLPNRQSSPNGVVKADGQWITNASSQYPAVVADLQSSTPSVPVVTPSAWESDPLNRAAWAYDSANNRIRVPDWNGVQAGSIGPLMFRGDGTLGFAPGKVRQDQIQNITGTLTAALNGALVRASDGAATGAFKLRTPTVTNSPSFTSTAGNHVDFDASGSVRTGTETFPSHGVGVWGVVLFGSVSNPGAADAAALATSYANQQAQITALQNRRKFFQSSQQTLAQAGQLTLAHGFGIEPWQVDLHVECVVATNGYEVGDKVKVAQAGADLASAYGVSITWDATNIYIRFGNIAGVFLITHKTTGAITNLTTLANWRAVVRAQAWS